MSRRVLIGIAGGTASGKTSIANDMRQSMGADQAVVIRLDDYYRQLTGDLEERGRTNFDHPDAFEWPLLEQHISALLEGQTVPVPSYDHSIHQRRESPQATPSRSVIILEGILALWPVELRQLMHLKVFVDTPPDIRLARRIRRDVAERGRTLDAVIEQYESTVRPMHEQFCEPSKAYADVVIPRGATNRVAVQMVLSGTRSLIQGDERQRSDKT